MSMFLFKNALCLGPFFFLGGDFPIQGVQPSGVRGNFKVGIYEYLNICT